MRNIIALLFLAAAAVASASDAEFNPIHLLRPRSASRGSHLDCLSWRLSVETHNLRNWKLVPDSCEDYVGNYMLGSQYRLDCDAVADVAIEYAQGLSPAADGLDVWIFDIDETALSNMPYYARTDVLFGALPYNDTKFNEWVAEGKAPAVPAVRRLYKTLVSLNIKVVFLSGSAERYTDVRVVNLKKAGYKKWEKLILKGEADKGLSALGYKSKKRGELVAKGYRILGNIGDQWSDLLGTNVGNRTFKVPDPMYYIG